MRSGAVLDASGVGRVSGMFGAGRLLEVVVTVVVLLRLAKEFFCVWVGCPAG